eukprot:TRINITY_DN1738_c0_g1_i1.p1 TRINITY_DN1738_c0_g1~~TRINITY_DN1738_c0_g1_i1.p1  ORF type:complete len:286 (+),score=26.16 TRINITY_DN1738_c0_g1_i1:183-1040(+)
MEGQSFPEAVDISIRELHFPEDDFTIGSGGFGKVRKAIYKGKYVAYKRFHDTYQEPMLDITQFRFEQDLDYIKKLQHKNIVRIIGVIKEQGHRGIVMELMKCSLEYYIHVQHEQRDISIRNIYRIVLNMAAAVSFLQNNSTSEEFVSHGDIHPDNVFIDFNDVVKIGDFGLACLFQRTKSGVDCPVHAYVAPEQYRGIRSRKSDVFSIGLIAWELYTRRQPLDEYACPWYQLNEGLRPEIPEGMPPFLAQLIQDCWKQDKDERPSAGKVRDRCADELKQIRQSSK